MDGSRSALIIASDDYDDPGLGRLRAPASDANALAAVLRDPQIGGFEVRTLLNQPAHQVNLAVEEFFADRRPDDLLLLHFSGHGLKDEGGELYFAAANTRLRMLGSTAVAAEFVNRRMGRSRSRRVVLLLDCCYAGAFERGMTPRAGVGMAIEEQFGGRGRAVITASSAMEYAFEGDQLTDSQALAPSVFTSALVEGLETGEADRDQDGMVALDELYDYVYDRVRDATPNQTPGKWTFGVQGELVIARRARPVTTPAPLPPELQAAIDHPIASVRSAVVQELARVAQGRHAGLALAARMALEHLTDDDSRTVSAAATVALDTQVLPTAPPTPPKPVPPRLELSAATVEFGRLPQHSRSPERTVRLGNAGGGSLNARATTQAGWLELRQVGDELVLGVDTTGAGDHEGVVTVDSDGGSATIRVTATVDVLPSPAPPPPAAPVDQPEDVEEATTGDLAPPPPAPPPPDDIREDPLPHHDQAPEPGGDAGGPDWGATAPPRAGTVRTGPSRPTQGREEGRRQLLIWAATVVVAAALAYPSPLLAVIVVVLGAAASAASRFGPGVGGRSGRRRLLRDHCRFLDRRTAELPLVRDLRDPLAFGVRKVSLAAPAQPGVPSDWPLYVRRDVDEELDRALRRGGVVLLVGEAQAGKTRTAFEAMHRVCADRQLLVPKGRESLRVLADAGLTFPHAVVWLDDLDGYLGVNQLDQALHDLAGRHADSVVLATMRSGEYAQYCGESPSRNPGARRGSGDATPGLFRSSSRLLGDMATVIPMSPQWSQAERHRAREQGRDPRIAEALQQSGAIGLVEYMTSGPQLWKKWRDALLGVQPVGAAIVAAVVDCRRVGLAHPVPVDLLRSLHGAYLEGPAAGADAPGAFEDGLAWACQGHALIRPVDDAAGGRGYVASAYLVDAVQRNPDAYPVPEATWRLVVECLVPEEAWNVGSAAYRAGLPHVAELAFRVGTHASRTDVRANAAYGLANVLLDGDETAEAETWLKVAADAGVTAAATNLGWLLERRGERSRAEWYYRQAYRQGDLDAANNLGVLLAEGGNDGAAEDWLSKAHQAGHSKATNNLGLLLLRRGDRDGARRMFRQAAALGNEEAEQHLRELPPDGAP